MNITQAPKETTLPTSPNIGRMIEKHSLIPEAFIQETAAFAFGAVNRVNFQKKQQTD